MKASGLILALPLAFALLALPAHAGEVQAAVAANFAGPMQRIAAEFQKETGHTVKLVFGSSGLLHSQIKAGAPFDVLLAADENNPAVLEAEGLAAPGTRFVYALGRLALWSTQPGLVDGEGAVLRSNKYDRLAVADARLAPYGLAARETLEHLGIWPDVQSRLVTGESIAQAYQFAASGNAELGLVALSQITRDGKVSSGSYWLVPARLHGPIRQSAVLLAAARDKDAARALLAYLKGDRARAVIRSYGYDLP